MSFKFISNSTKVLKTSLDDITEKQLRTIISSVLIISIISVFFLIYSIYYFFGIFLSSYGPIESDIEILNYILNSTIFLFILNTMKYFSFFMLYFILIIPVSGIIFSFFEEKVIKYHKEKYNIQNIEFISENIFLSIWYAFKFLLKLIIVNLFLIPFYIFLPGLSFLLLSIFNGYIVGKELYFQILRKHLKKDQQMVFIKYDNGEFFFLGLSICLLSSVPILNLFLPIFGLLTFSNLFYMKRVENIKEINSEE